MFIKIKTIKMSSGGPTYIRHERFLDVAIMLKKDVELEGTNYVVVGKYVNMGFVETFDLGVPITVKIPASKLEQWLICRNPKEDSIRKSKWVSLAPKEG